MLNELTHGASKNGNVLELAINAAREGATVGEISVINGKSVENDIKQK